MEVRLVNVLKNKLVLGFLIFVLAISVGIGITVWHYGSTYEKTAALYTKTMDWVLPLSIDYVHLSMDEETGLFTGLGKEYKDTINTEGEIIEHQKIREYHFESEYLGEGLTTFEENDSVGAKDEKGNIIIPAEHQSILPFEDSYCIALSDKGYDVIYDKNGKLLKEGHAFYQYLINNKFTGEIDGTYEIFDLSTGEIWREYKDRKFSEIFLLDDQTIAIGFPTQTSEFYLIDYVLFDGQMQPLMGDKTFSVAGGLSEGMRYFITSDRTFDGKATKVEAGFMNENGDTIFLFNHVPECVNDYKDGLAIVYDEKQFYAIDKMGKKVFCLDYTGNAVAASRSDMIDFYNTGSNYCVQFQEGVAPFTLDGKNWGYIDKTGKIIIEPVFKSASPVYQGCAVVCGAGAIGPGSIINSRWGVLDLKEVLKDVQ